MISDPLAIALLSSISGILIAYITNVVARRVQAHRSINGQKDRVEKLFDAYDRTLKQKEMDNDELREMLQGARAQIIEIQRRLDDTERKLDYKDLENERLKREMNSLRHQYRHEKTDFTNEQIESEVI